MLPLVRKGQKELTMIISLIILLVLAVVIISLMLTFLRPEGLQNLGKEEIDTERAKLECRNLCEGVRTATPEDLNSRIWSYCAKSFVLQKSDEGFQDLIIVGEGETSYCRDSAHCFNIQGGECQARGVKIDASVCRDAMCKVLVGNEVDQFQAEENIKETMVAGSCNLRQGAEVVKPGGEVSTVFVKTWWERYFESPQCSNFVGSGSGGGGSSGGQCGAYCQNIQGGNYTGATSGACVNVASCNVPGVPEPDASFCDGANLEVCCCTA